MLRRVVSFSLLALLAACAAPEREPGPRLTASEGRARVASLLPKSLGDRTGWATDIYAALASLGVEPSAENICSVIAITEQESGFRADPAVANLAAIAWKEIERQREKLGIPSLVLQAALALDSSDGRSYKARIDAVKTEHELSNIYEEIIDRVPLGRRLLADRNPVRTGGPMQVAIAFAQAHAKRKSYPYPVAKTIREEVFTRRGGLYFGTAHLLDYPADYDAPIYRFADFNAGQYASRNAALQKAITELTGLPLELDGDLVTRETKDGSPGTTERAARQLASRLGMSAEQIRGDLELESSPDLPRSRLYRRVFEMAEAAAGKPMPRAVIPQIKLSSPKITRNLTTEWFAKRVETRHRACMRQGVA